MCARVPDITAPLGERPCLEYELEALVGGFVSQPCVEPVGIAAPFIGGQLRKNRATVAAVLMRPLKQCST